MVDTDFNVDKEVMIFIFSDKIQFRVTGYQLRKYRFSILEILVMSVKVHFHRFGQD